MRTNLTALIFFFLCLCFSVALTQSYKPFPEGNAFWIEQHGRLQTGPCGFEYQNCTDPVYFGNDIVINSVIYHTLMYRQVCSITWVNGSPPPPPPCEYITYYNVPPTGFAHIRQDSVAKKVYMYDWSNNQDTLLYDFNLSVGNPLPHTYNNPNYPNVIVSSIDSILLIDGYHRRYNLDIGTTVDSASIIEGIGSTYGLLASLVPPFENGDALLCFSKNNFTIYPNASTACDFTVGMLSEKDEHVLNVYPNPADDFINIQNHFTSPLSVTVFSSYGTVVHQITLAKDANATIDLSALANGIYMVAGVSDKYFVSEKVIKQ
jgi:hypothetical protein